MLLPGTSKPSTMAKCIGALLWNTRPIAPAMLACVVIISGPTIVFADNAHSNHHVTPPRPRDATTNKHIWASGKLNRITGEFSADQRMRGSNSDSFDYTVWKMTCVPAQRKFW